LGCALAAPDLAAAGPTGLAFPGKEPGIAHSAYSDIAGSPVLWNAVTGMGWEIGSGHFRPAYFASGLALGVVQLKPSEAFVLVFRNGRELKASEMRIRKYNREDLPADPAACRAAERSPGKQVSATLETEDGKLQVQWHAVLRNGSNYIRQIIDIRAVKGDADIAKIIMVDHVLPKAEVCGTVPGSPVISGNVFTGLEHPMSKSRVEKDKIGAATAVCWLERALPLGEGKSFTCSSVLGVTPQGQLRRGFLYYIERERAHPYRPFLHYNSWYDISFGRRFDEKDCLDSITAFATELGEKRGVKLDSFLFDDGWDDTRRGGQWQFHGGFPRGFSPLSEAAARCGAAPGVWLSPWGGYGQARKERVASGMAAGFETDGKEHDPGFALSGPKYYAQFHKVCEEMITKYGINQFKFDGTGNINSVMPGSRFGSDFEAAIQLIRDLRAIKPDLYVNLTTRTWPSPFWLAICDSVWRGGADHSFAGVGSARQRWMTYRDGETYRHVVKGGPLYPISSLMIHGLIYAKHADQLDKDPGDDFSSEVRSYFASGTQLQEMYISHGLLSAKNWDTIAQCAKWSRANAATLVDSHWIGGDPQRLEVYGWASWSAAKGIFALRNPSDKPQEAAVDVGKYFELPAAAATVYKITSPFQQRAIKELGGTLEAGEPAAIRLEPFEVLVFEAAPLR
jgi:hypothetical protein